MILAAKLCESVKPEFICFIAPPFLFDTVVMNPPFGTKPGNKGIDVLFLERGRRLLRPGGTLYSLHKSSTRAFLLKKAKKEWGMVEAEVVAELKFDIPQMYKFHRWRMRIIQR